MTASVNGFYAVYLSGKQGQGFALIAFKDGRIAGADASGTVYDGQYTEQGDDNLSVTVLIKYPPNIPLVQGGTTGPQGEERQLSFQMPKNFSDQKFIRVETQDGPVNARLVKLRGIDV
jgi:hypothetical protein